MSARRRTAGALEDELPGHELAVVLADRSISGFEARVGSEGALGPFPDAAEEAGLRLGNDGSSVVELLEDEEK